MYDTAAGFLDNILIEKRNQEGKRIRQGIRVKENMFWTTDASFNIKKRIKSLDNKVLSIKAKLVGKKTDNEKLKDLDKKIFNLEDEKQALLKVAAEKYIRKENRDEERNRLRSIYAKIRELTNILNEEFEIASKDNPLYGKLPFKVLAAERAQLAGDLEYLDKAYFEDKKVAQEGSKATERYAARQRVEAFEAKYKSFDVLMAFRGIELHGGMYVRDLINESLKSVGFIDPQLEGLENIKISAVNADYTVSSAGPAKAGDKPGIAIKNLHIPLIKASAIVYKTETMLFEAGKPNLQNVYVSVSLDFAKNPLDKDPNQLYKYVVSKVYIRKATLNGLTVKVGGADAEPLLDFPATVPVEAWGIRLWDYDPEKRNINLRIQDLKAEGTYSNQDIVDNSSQKVAFGVDTTKDN